MPIPSPASPHTPHIAFRGNYPHISGGYGVARSTKSGNSRRASVLCKREGPYSRFVLWLFRVLGASGDQYVPPFLLAARKENGHKRAWIEGASPTATLLLAALTR